MNYIENYTFDEIDLGQQASITRTLTQQDILMFAAVSGDVNPAHLDPDFAKTDLFHHIVGHGMWSATLISTVLGTKLPGAGTIYLDQSLAFKHPIAIGDTITVTVKVLEKNKDKNQITLSTQCINQHGKIILYGQALVLAPAEKIRHPVIQLPEIKFEYQAAHLLKVLEHAKTLNVAKTAVVHPTSGEALMGAIKASEENLIQPILIGPKNKILQAAKETEISLDNFELIDTPHSHAAAEIAAKLAFEGNVDMIMKGSLHTDELLHACLKGQYQLKTDRRLSHVFVMDVPSYPKLLLITDAAINIEPCLEDKVSILQNAIDLAIAIGIVTPKVAILSATETVNPKLKSTIDASALCKMADRGQIKGAILDGPLAFDNAVSLQAANIKNIISPVAGKADILLVPDLESGNMLAKQLDYLANAKSAGIALGAKVPIILTSRADTAEERVMSCALGLHFLHFKEVSVNANKE